MRAAEVIRSVTDRLSAADAKQIVADLDHGTGRIAQVVSRNPWLRRASQAAAREQLGETFSVYRAVTLTEAIRPDHVASTSLDWRVCWAMLDQSPSIVWHGGNTYSTKKALLHYQLTPEQVVLWIPVAMKMIEATLRNQMHHRVEDRHGTPIRIATVLSAIHGAQEQEIVADLSGLTPKTLVFDGSVAGRDQMHALHDYLSGEALPQGGIGAKEERDEMIRRFADWRR